MLLLAVLLLLLLLLAGIAAATVVAYSLCMKQVKTEAKKAAFTTSNR
jgi:uncharacterized protein YneF (UPF0154 family)